MMHAAVCDTLKDELGGGFISDGFPAATKVGVCSGTSGVTSAVVTLGHLCPQIEVEAVGCVAGEGLK